MFNNKIIELENQKCSRYTGANSLVVSEETAKLLLSRRF